MVTVAPPPARRAHHDVFSAMSLTKLIESVKVNAQPAQDNSENHVVLSLENVSKRFCRDLKSSLYYGVQDISRELVGKSQRAEGLRSHEFWALQNINFELRSGDVMGIVGINGCGKTTLMRIIAGLIKPTTGKITVRGRLAPLLALGAGFNPVLTGRENIFANMSVLGLTYDEIHERFDDVVKFSEIGYAIDAPVQTYSSGMLARLGFACAINTQPDILLLDEVLAVGDMNFRRKCLERLFELRASGMSLVIVHHSPGILLAIAQSGLYLRRGEVVQRGSIGDVIKIYEQDLLDDMPTKARGSVQKVEEEMPPDDREVQILSLKLAAANGGTVASGEDAVITVAFRVHQPLDQLNTTFNLYRKSDSEDAAIAKDRQVLKMLSRREGGSLTNVQPGDYEISLDLPSLGLLGGLYYLRCQFTRPPRLVLATRRSEPFLVESDSPLKNSDYYQKRTWQARTSAGQILETTTTFNAADAADDFLETEGELK